MDAHKDPAVQHRRLWGGIGDDSGLDRGAYCEACSADEQDYVWPCRLLAAKDPAAPAVPGLAVPDERPAAPGVGGPDVDTAAARQEIDGWTTEAYSLRKLAYALCNALDAAHAERDAIQAHDRKWVAERDGLWAQRDSARDIAAALEAELADRDTTCPCTPFVEQLATAWDEGARSGAASPTIMARNPYRAAIAGETS